MKVPRSTVVTAGLAAAAALAATGITYASAASAPVPQSAPAVAAAAPGDGFSGQGKGNEGRGGRQGREGDWGRILINERSYSAHPGDCITVVSGLGARTLNIRNDTRKTVEVFRGAVCDNGAPIATVGPHSSADGVRPCPTHEVDVRRGVVASFRVVRHHGGDWD
ncbi:hypothetical protein SRB17_47650 [Streptomyces sp. RB17]|uniref:hypothetical protein n=1 Tax=Streptomyces sp. RB17 TaxID=2585197 RepID=UPI001294F071|nr:hypothetical protein [Streptomyces sp. RB17]MQY36763.1 hypothetical protein [Streptomyces sp. RB17]